MIEFTNHDIFINDNAYYECKKCGQTWTREPVSKCVGVPVMSWDEPNPRYLLTKTQLSEAGYQTGKKLPPIAAVIPRKKSPQGYMKLYDVRKASPKRKATPAQKAALAKARAKRYQCKKCGNRLAFKYEISSGICELCHHENRLKEANKKATQWAKTQLSNPDVLILDTETTGLYKAHLVEIAIIDINGNIILNTRVKPDKPIEPDATRIHGISIKDVENAPHFTDIYQNLRDALEGKRIVVYNESFDIPILIREIRRNGLDLFTFKSDCAMKAYARWFGDWSDYHESWKWQPLDGGDHTALGDARATLTLLHDMAKNKTV